MSVCLSISAPEEEPNMAPYIRDDKGSSHVIIFTTCGIISAILVVAIITAMVLMKQKTRAASKRLRSLRKEVANPIYTDHPMLGEGDLDIPYDPEWELPRAK